MEQGQTKIDQKVENTSGKAEPTTIDIQDVPDLTFKQIGNHPTQLYSCDIKKKLPRVRYQQNMDSYAIRAIRKNHLLLYRIKDKKIELFSNHTFCFPPILRQGAQGFHKKEISQRAFTFYGSQRHGGDQNSFIAYEFKYGPYQPKIFEPDVFPCQQSWQKWRGWNYLAGSKPLSIPIFA